MAAWTAASPWVLVNWASLLESEPTPYLPYGSGGLPRLAPEPGVWLYLAEIREHQNSRVFHFLWYEPAGPQPRWRRWAVQFPHRDGRPLPR